MKRRLLSAGFGLALGSVLLVGYLLNSNYWDNRNPFMRGHMWHVTRAWTGVPDLPADARNFKIETSGDFLTRKFKSSFSAPRSSVESWLTHVPDLDQAERTDLADGGREYVGRGKEGATSFTLELGPDMTDVNLSVSWN